MTELEQFILSQPMADTHDQQERESAYPAYTPDILAEIFSAYLPGDLAVAGASQEAIQRLLKAEDPDVAGRFRSIEPYWQLCRHTGYGEAARAAAKLIYGIEEITAESLAACAPRAIAQHKPGIQYRLMHDLARLDHVQNDRFDWNTAPDEEHPGFFFYDLNWAACSNGRIDLGALYEATGVTVRDVDTLRGAFITLFARHAPTAVAVKSQHAYERTLLWRARSDAEVEPTVVKRLRGEDLDEGERLCLGDWALARAAELAAEHDLPVKIHTGYYAGHGYMVTERIRPGLLCDLFIQHPKTRFVLMHMGYPYADELVAVAKHFPNVYPDMCWGWAMNPRVGAEFVRRTIHAVPSNKPMVFGGDSGYPHSVVGYAHQARRWLLYALQGEIDDGFLTERDAIELVGRFMLGNARDCFRIESKRQQPQ